MAIASTEMGGHDFTEEGEYGDQQLYTIGAFIPLAMVEHNGDTLPQAKQQGAWMGTTGGYVVIQRPWDPNSRSSEWAADDFDSGQHESLPNIPPILIGSSSGSCPGAGERLGVLRVGVVATRNVGQRPSNSRTQAATVMAELLEEGERHITSTRDFIDAYRHGCQIPTAGTAASHRSVSEGEIAGRHRIRAGALMADTDETSRVAGAVQGAVGSGRLAARLLAMQGPPSRRPTLSLPTLWGGSGVTHGRPPHSDASRPSAPQVLLVVRLMRSETFLGRPKMETESTATPSGLILTLRKTLWTAVCRPPTMGLLASRPMGSRQMRPARSITHLRRHVALCCS